MPQRQYAYPPFVHISCPYSLALNSHMTGSIRLHAQTIDFLTRIKSTEFNVSDVKPLPNSTRPFVSFEAKGNLYFVHGETFANKQLLRRLLGRALKKAELEPLADQASTE